MDFPSARIGRAFYKPQSITNFAHHISANGAIPSSAPTARFHCSLGRNALGIDSHRQRRDSIGAWGATPQEMIFSANGAVPL